MKLLIDTHVFIGLARGTLQTVPKLWAVFERDDVDVYLSSASIWEIAIKIRLGKLDAGIHPYEIAAYCTDIGIGLLPISAAHASHSILPEPQTRDPFDRMLLAQCAVEGMKLVSVDRLLVDHPLVLRN